jgi:hypothetical protein
VTVRTGGTRAYGDDEDFAATFDGNSLDGGERRGIELADLLRDLFDRVVADLLAHDGTGRRHAEEDATTTMVEHGAEGSCTGTTLAGRGLELEGL